MKCAGDSTKNCGGSKAISLYQKCAAGASCVNAGSGASPSGSAPNSTTTAIVQSPPADAISTSSSAFLGPYTNATATASSGSVILTVSSSMSDASPSTLAGNYPTTISSIVNVAPSDPAFSATTTAPSSLQTTLLTVTKAPSMSSKHIPAWHSRTITTTFLEYYWS
jgi:hypothetical protein